MAEILLLTEDTRLHRLLFLLCTEAGHTVGSTAPSLIITDTKQIPTRFAALPILFIGEGGVPRPFSHDRIKADIASLLSKEASPLLSPTEEKLYRVLKDASPDFVTRECLIRAVFGCETDDGRLNLYIHYLRKKIETDGKKHIVACRGKGYALSC
ncbi:MAG: winged helix-turn-helix domain-containing protein [Ruminococcaceae bacterium]|nr:winged helix-turn-helix domain-containing protein [Oscillospiraceae bacterium]